MTTNECSHAGHHSRKFGGAIGCDDCTALIGNWRIHEPARTLPATEQPDATLHAHTPTAPPRGRP